MKLVALSALWLLTFSAPQQTAPPAIDRLWAEATAASPTPVRLRDEHRSWVEQGSDDDDDSYRERLQASLAADRKARALRLSFNDLGGACIDLALDQGCGPTSVGYLTDAPGGGRLYWQIQEGASAADGVGGGVVILREAGGRLQPILWDFQAWRYAAPELVMDGEAGAPLLVLRGTSRGTSASPVDLVYQWRDGTWRQVDTDAWWDELPGKADGLTVESGVRIDYATLGGVTPLWRDGDGACCPGGGWADLRFELRDDALHLAEVRRLE